MNGGCVCTATTKRAVSCGGEQKDKAPRFSSGSWWLCSPQEVASVQLMMMSRGNREVSAHEGSDPSPPSSSCSERAVSIRPSQMDSFPCQVIAKAVSVSVTGHVAWEQEWGWGGWGATVWTDQQLAVYKGLFSTTSHLVFTEFYTSMRWTRKCADL